MMKLSRHAEKRAQQRGAKPGLVELVLNYADVEVPVGSNCQALRVSRRMARGLNLGDRVHLYAVVVSGLYAVVVSGDTGEIMTITLSTERGCRGARYRRGWKERGWRDAHHRRKRR